MRRRHLLAGGLVAGAGASPLGHSARAQPGLALFDTIAMEGSGAEAGTVVPFAYAFPPGHLPRGVGLAVHRGDNGVALPTQFEAKTCWPDGSARHALITVAAPALGDGALLPLQLRPAEGPAAGARLDFAGRSAVVEIYPDTPDGSGTPWRCDLMTQPAGARWRDGPLVAETRVVVAVPAAALGTGVMEVQAVTRGAAGGQDRLPHGHVRRILQVNQGGRYNPDYGSFEGGKTFRPGESWLPAGDAVAWSPAGPEPAPGESYTVVYTRATTAGQVQSLRLIADLAVLADGTFACDLALRNDAALRPGGGTATLSVRLLLDGVEVLRYRDVALGLYQALVRRRSMGRGGAKAVARPTIRPNVQYLADAGAVHRYDARLGVAPERRRAYAALPEHPFWDAPLSARGFLPYMPNTGGRWEIGPATEPQVIWLLTGDRGVQQACLDHSEALAGVPWHFWDAVGGDEGRGGWLDPRRHPERWADTANRDRGFQPRIPPDTGWTPDNAHTPAGHYVPYLLTGRRSCLDGVQAQASYAIMSCWPSAGARGRAVDLRTGEGVNVIRDQQVRAGGWNLRALLDAAYVTPPEEPNGRFWPAAVAANLAWMRGQIPVWTRRQGQAHGYLTYPLDPPATDHLSPWMNDMLASSLWKAAKAGYADAGPVLAWVKNWAIGRFLHEAEGFPAVDGVAYRVIIGKGDGALYQSWAQLAAATRAAGLSNADRTRGEGTYYGPYGAATVAMFLDLTPDDPEARRAWEILGRPAVQAVLSIAAADFRRSCIQSIVPPGATRA